VNNVHTNIIGGGDEESIVKLFSDKAVANGASSVRYIHSIFRRLLVCFCYFN
jgi:hypothetical protein